MTARAVLLAGGIAVVPVMGRSWLGRLVRRLDKYGIAAVVLGLYHQAEVITGHFGDGSAYMTPLLLSDEPVLFGTGGAIRFSAFPADATVLVLNAGVYCFEPEVLMAMPSDHPFSVKRERFPDLVVAGVPVYGYPLHGYWRDIGTRNRYLDLHADILNGNCPAVAPEGREIGPGLWVGPGAQIDPGASVTPPVAIGAGSIVESGAHVGPQTVIGANCRISLGARVERSVLCSPGKRPLLFQRVPGNTPHR